MQLNRALEQHIAVFDGDRAMHVAVGVGDEDHRSRRDTRFPRLSGAVDSGATPSGRAGQRRPGGVVSGARDGGDSGLAAGRDRFNRVGNGDGRGVREGVRRQVGGVQTAKQFSSCRTFDSAVPAEDHVRAGQAACELAGPIIQQGRRTSTGPEV